MMPTFSVPLLGTISTYALFFSLGYLAAVGVGVYLAQTQFLSAKRIADLCLLALFSSLVGARLLFVLTNWDYFSTNLIQALNPFDGGLVFYGGLLFTFPIVILFLRILNLPIEPYLDILSISLCLGHAIGRIGCWFSGCCFGDECSLPWAIFSNGHWVHPVQLYESLFLFVLFFFLLKKIQPSQNAGKISAIYLTIYSLGRFTLEYFRGDAIRGFIPGTPISTSQAISALLFFAGIYWWRLRHIGRNH